MTDETTRRYKLGSGRRCLICAKSTNQEWWKRRVNSGQGHVAGSDWFPAARTVPELDGAWDKADAG